MGDRAAGLHFQLPTSRLGGSLLGSTASASSSASKIGDFFKIAPAAPVCTCIYNRPVCEVIEKVLKSVSNSIFQ